MEEILINKLVKKLLCQIFNYFKFMENQIVSEYVIMPNGKVSTDNVLLVNDSTVQTLRERPCFFCGTIVQEHYPQCIMKYPALIIMGLLIIGIMIIHARIPKD